ncbi:hypothetical protein ND860_18790, partial [Leptospira levettii]|uniref:hypothetical protein n=1 Tax=Leptospira levettii TaxID=2023178 RepID=UPI00223D964D
PSLGLKPHSSSARYLPTQVPVPTLTPALQAQLRGTSVSLFVIRHGEKALLKHLKGRVKKKTKRVDLVYTKVDTYIYANS